MIAKGVQLSLMYPGNEGLLLRSRFNALARSTMRDFETLTGLTVSETKKKVEIITEDPERPSTIHFVHCEDMDDFKMGIQGMNLGWAGIEQGDELESPDVFEMLNGRMRRILTPCQQIQEELIKLGIIKKTRKDFKVFSKEMRKKIELAIIEQLGLTVRQLMVIANACGHNWIYKRWIKPLIENKPLLPGYEYSEGEPFGLLLRRLNVRRS
jgi:hypothetical protein